jgi:uncharacterized protein
MSSVKREALKWSRTLHIYFSLLGMLMFLFFALTGIMLTHDSWGLDQVESRMTEAQFPRDIAGKGQQDAVVRQLRSMAGISLPVANYAVDPDQLEVTFSGPGKRTQARINREDGHTEFVFESRGVVGIIADLHKGAETGWPWRIMMDLASVWLILSAISGFLMLLALPKRRRMGLILAALATIAVAATYMFYVPR